MSATRPSHTTLREVRATAQDRDDLRRRWFNSPELDLFTWQDDSGSLAALQLCYQIDSTGFALRWERGRGYHHEAIDDGESRPARHKMSPLLVRDGEPDAPSLVRRFSAAAAELDGRLRDAVLDCLAGYALERRDDTAGSD